MFFHVNSIDTHDISSSATLLTENSQVNVMTLYFEGSSAAGALYEFIFITDSGAVDFTRSALVALNRSTSGNYVLPFNLSAGQYRVFVYDIEQNGTVWGGVQYPASRDEVTINESNSGTKCVSVDYNNCIFFTHTAPLFQPMLSHIEDCTIRKDPVSITVQCTYSPNSQATGFQVIAQQISNSSQVHRLYVEQTTHTTATVEVEETGVYQVSIFPLREGTGILDSNVEYTQQVSVVEATTEPPTTLAATRRGEWLRYSSFFQACIYTYRLKNYYWPLAVFLAKLPNGQPLSKVVGPLGRPSEECVNRQNRTEICYKWLLFSMVISIVANCNGKCIK